MNIDIIFRKLRAFFLIKQKEWKNIEYFDPKWEERIHALAAFISLDTTSVCDFGSGQEWLRSYINPKIKYYGVDYLERTNSTIVRDINKHELPPASTMQDCIFSSGFFEYVEDPIWLIDEWTLSAHTIIISYCTIEDYPKISTRMEWGWKNHFSMYEIVSMFIAKGFLLVKINKLNSNTLFCFRGSA